jgi:hypothetical protein
MVTCCLEVHHNHRKYLTLMYARNYDNDEHDITILLIRLIIIIVIIMIKIVINTTIITITSITLKITVENIQYLPVRSLLIC